MDGRLTRRPYDLGCPGCTYLNACTTDGTSARQSGNTADATTPSSSLMMPVQSATATSALGVPETNTEINAAAISTPSAFDDHMWYGATHPYLVNSNVVRDTWTTINTTSGNHS